MKKIFVICLFFVTVCAVQAQRPVGDTLTMPEQDYYSSSSYLQAWPIGERGEWRSFVCDKWLLYGNFERYMRNSHLRDGNYIGGMQMFTERPLKIVGIAVCAYMQRPMDTVISSMMGYYTPYDHEFHPEYFFLNTWDTTLKNRVTDSAILYKVTSSGPQKLASAPWRIEHPHRFIHLPPIDTVYPDIVFGYDYHTNPFMPWTWTSNLDQDPVLPLYEVMFDSAVVVEDSFVVASTALNNEMSAGVVSPPCCPSLTVTMWLWDHNPTRFYNVVSPFWSDTILDTTCIAWVKYRQMNWKRKLSQSSFGRLYDHGGVLIRDTAYYYSVSYPHFPIIEVGFDTVMCHDVRNLRVAMRGYGRATLTWDSGDGGPWIVAHGKMLDSWNDYTFDTVTSPTLTLTGLEVGTVYFALVRGYCSLTGEYGDWSSPLEVEVFQQGSDEPIGIEQAGDLGRFVHLMPNPARDVVSVLSSYRMSRVVLYDLNGRTVLEQEADGITAVLDVSGLASGTYIAAIYLPHGVLTKKLVVEATTPRQ